MKICNIGPLPPPYGGVATFNYYVLSELHKRGHEVHVILPIRSLSKEKYPFSVHFIYPSKVEIKAIFVILYLILKLVLYYPVKFKNFHSIKFLFNVLRISIINIKGLSSLIGVFDRCIKVVTENKIDILCGHHAGLQGLIACALARTLNRKAAVFIYGGALWGWLEEKSFLLPIKLQVINYIWNNADVLFSCSHNTTRRAKILGAPIKKITTIMIGVDSKKFNPTYSPDEISHLREKLGLKENEFILLYVGILTPKKGAEFLLKSFNIAKQEVSDRSLKLIFVGPNYGYRELLEKLSYKLGLCSDVFFTGEVPDEELLLYYNLANIVVAPVLTEQTAMLLSVVEAMASGKPVIATNIAGLPEIVVDGKTSFIIEPGNINELAERIIRLSSNKKLERSMGQAARSYVVTNFSWDNVVNDVEKKILEFSK